MATIAGGKFSLDGKVYKLNLNDGQNHLHGGPKGFFKVIWDIEQLDSQSVRLTYVSPDGEEGYPGEVKISVFIQLPMTMLCELTIMERPTGRLF